MFGNPHIHAIADVRIECPPEAEDRLRWFYADVLGLRPAVPGDDAAGPAFAAHGLVLRIEVRPDARPSPVRRRLVVQIDSLVDAEQRLRDMGLGSELLRGMGIGDRRLVVLDPAGNRVELKEVQLL